MNNSQLLLKTLDVICESRLWKDKPPLYSLNILTYMDKKEWLYTDIEEGKVKAVIGAYRIPEVTEEILGKLPNDEEGNILYVLFVVSLNKDNNILRTVRKITKVYLERHPYITEIVLENKNNRLMRYKIGARNGQQEIAAIAASATISK